ncbi:MULTISPECIES: holo-ACP synthase [Prosthecochloris]|uniref:Holo-[acyl-carrier-protein] synthase n=1 Tax=Prosthecochloris vibrioformis TaxID=1098 RepID=A0A5C4S099_PROVB|nr:MULTISPECIES: holo-ACP synthase [Prosthecochloris]ANT64008.1 Holo-[acyl-carrier-protein] synthase [Prosthecochloris sp. CIB 2401]TNJ36301.1 holo-[acyl-carrier-protein] synthase [Prosthecochloris vibrioformis]
MTGARGIGVDIVDIERIEKSVEHYGEKFLLRVLTEQELESCRHKADMTASIAARFAAKEALSKALGSGFSSGFGWHSVEVRNNEAGQPFFCVLDSSLGLEEVQIKLSISHDGGMAVAFVLVEG